MTKVLSRVVAVAATLTAALVVSGAAADAATPVDVYPYPGSGYEMPRAQIAFRGVPAAQIGSVTVVGSKSGSHAGTVQADSDGDGGSFVPGRPFTAGETVTVSTSLDITGAPGGKFTFRIANPGKPLTGMKLPQAPAGSGGVQRFHSRPDLQPASVRVTENRSSAWGDGAIFVAPQFGPTQNGPMILNASGQLVWFDPSPIGRGQLMTDFRVQALYNKPVLTWWQGTTNNGSGQGAGYVYNQNYQLQQIVRPVGGLTMDLHEFSVTNSGQAYFICVEPVWLPGVHRPVQDAEVQEIDMKTGLLLWEWNALDHIPPSQSSFYGPRQSGHVLDPFHLNSVQAIGDGSVLISARNTSAVYQVDRDTGKTIWTLGGRGSSFTMGKGASFALQHDAILQPDGSVTIFDDGAGPPRVHDASRGIRLTLDLTRHTATLAHQYAHAPNILADFEGSVQALSDGNLVLGWGQQPYFSESNAAGQQIFDAHFVEPTSSYRAYRFPWAAQPPTKPSTAVIPGSDGTIKVYASWNGATDVARWQVLSGASAGALTPAASAPAHGFETGISLGNGNSVVEVQALGASGQVLATSSATSVRSHLTFYGRSAFVQPNAMGSVPVGCFIGRACSVSTTVTSGSHVLAATGHESIGANSTGLVYFRLSPSAEKALARSKRQTVTMTTRSVGSTLGASTTMTLISAPSAASTGKLDGSGPLSLLGRTDYVSSTGIGGVLGQCQSAAPCPAKLTITAGGTPIATTGVETMGPHQAGYYTFSLNSAGRAMLARARGHAFGVTVALAGSGISVSGSIELDPFS